MWACHNQAAFGGHLIRLAALGTFPSRGRLWGTVQEIATGGKTALAMTEEGPPCGKGGCQRS